MLETRQIVIVFQFHVSLCLCGRPSFLGVLKDLQPKMAKLNLNKAKKVSLSEINIGLKHLAPVRFMCYEVALHNLWELVHSMVFNNNVYYLNS